MVAGVAGMQFFFELRPGTATQLTLASVVVSKSTSFKNGFAVAVKAVDAGGPSPVKFLSITVNDELQVGDELLRTSVLEARQSQTEVARAAVAAFLMQKPISVNWLYVSVVGTVAVVVAGLATVKTRSPWNSSMGAVEAAIDNML